MTHMHKPLEGLLRPPLEWYSSVFSMALLMSFNRWPNIFWLPTGWLLLVSAVLIVFSVWRVYQGFTIWQYQHHLRQMPRYTRSLQSIPVKSNHLFLGKGFLWEPILTQRLRDLDLAFNVHYVSTKKSVLGGHSQLHGVSLTEAPIFMNLADRGQHLLVLGTTGVGKTRFAELLIAQDIARGDIVIVLDPKGDVDLLRRVLIEAKRAGREQSVQILHLGFPGLSCRYNPIGFFTKFTQVATRIANALPSTGEAAAFKEFAWKYVNIVTRGLIALEIKPSYRLISFYLTKLDQLFAMVSKVLFVRDNILAEGFQQFSDTAKKGLGYTERLLGFVDHYLKSQGHERIIKDPTLQLLNDLMSACRMDRTYYDKITASVGPLLEKLTSGDIADLLSPDYANADDSRPVIDWLTVIRQKQIVYIGMDALTDPMISSVVGNALLADLVATAGYLYKFSMAESGRMPRIQLHSDEFNEIIGDEFIPLLNKARGAGFNITAYTQTWSDVEARLISKAKAGQVAGNLGSVVMFRCKEAKTVDMLLEQLPRIPILRATPASSSSDKPEGEDGVYFHSTNEDRLGYVDSAMLEQTDILNLPKGQAFALLEGGQLYKLRMPLPVEKMDDFPGDVGTLLTGFAKERSFYVR